MVALVDGLALERPATVTAYLSMPTEPSLDAAVAELASRGHRILIPRVAGAELSWTAWHETATQVPGPLGIRELDGPAVAAPATDSVDVLLIPGLAVDRQGHRLGQGGGYYDRFLSRLPRRADGGPLRAIILFDDEVLPEVAHEDHDERMDVAITPGGVIALA